MFYGDDQGPDLNSELNHSFDEQDEVVEEREFPPVQNRIQLSWFDIDIKAEPAPGCCGKKGEGEVKNILNGISGTALPG